jgi:hypothetical protein
MCPVQTVTHVSGRSISYHNLTVIYASTIAKPQTEVPWNLCLWKADSIRMRSKKCSSRSAGMA